MFEVLLAGAALGGLPLVGLLVMGFGALQLLAMLFVKVTLILIGALVFAIGPLMIGLVPLERGNAFARTWLTIASGLFVLPILWASIFALAAVLINDAARGASVIGGNSGLGETLGRPADRDGRDRRVLAEHQAHQGLRRPRRRPARPVCSRSPAAAPAP